MGLLSIHGVTLSVDFGDKDYGRGTGRFMSVSAKVPAESEGIPLEDADDIMRDGAEMYLTAWQTLMQVRCASGEISGPEYKRQTAAFLSMIGKLQMLYRKIKGLSPEELDAYLKRLETKNVSSEHPE